MSKWHSFHICPFCGEAFHSNNIGRHRTACQHRPDDRDLRQLWEDFGNATRVAAEIGVAATTVRKWLVAAEIDVEHPHVVGGSAPVRPPLAGPEFAPLYGCNRGCDFCGRLAECDQRMRQNLWPLCCLPSQHEVAWAYRDGLIGFDSRLPEWLPALLEIIR